MLLLSRFCSKLVEFHFKRLSFLWKEQNLWFHGVLANAIANRREAAISGFPGMVRIRITTNWPLKNELEWDCNDLTDLVVVRCPETSFGLGDDVNYFVLSIKKCCLLFCAFLCIYKIGKEIAGCWSLLGLNSWPECIFCAVEKLLRKIRLGHFQVWREFSASRSHFFNGSHAEFKTQIDYDYEETLPAERSSADLLGLYA